MLCDQQIATSFSVRDILEFDDSDGLIGNGVSPGPAVAATASGQATSLLEPIMLDPADGAADVNATGYYTNYWLENGGISNVSDNRMMMPMEEQPTVPTYIALQQHHHQPQQPQHHHPVPANIDPNHYDYSYNYMSYDCPSAEEFTRFRDEDETKQVAQRNPNRPLTTSHHVQQLSHLCPPFTEQEVGCGHSLEIAANKVKSTRKFRIEICLEYC